MYKKLRLFVINVIGALLITACSTASLQTTRLDKAEMYMTQAEQAISANRMKFATNNMGTAKAYLDTLKDNLKFLTKAEVKRYHLLRGRAKVVGGKVGLK